MAEKVYYGKNDVTPNVRPNFLRNKKSAGNTTAKGSLQAAEGAAIQEFGAPQLETVPKSLYTGTGAAPKKQLRAKATGKFSLVKKFLPVGAVGVIMAIIFFLFFGATSLLGAHIEALFTEATDTQYTSYSMRSTRLFSYMLDGGSQIKTNWDGTRKYTAFTPYMQSRLQKNGIKVGTVDDAGDFTEGNLLAGKSRVLQYNDEIISAEDFTTKFASDVDFREAYTNAKRGRIMGFFDDAADNLYQKLGLSRNIFSKFRQTGDNVADEANFRSTISDQFADESDVRINTVEERTSTDEDGNTTTERVLTGEDSSTKNMSGETYTKARNYLEDVTRKSAAGTSIACGALKVGNLIAVSVAANEIYQSIHYFQNLMEPISKAKAGEGSTSGINQVLNFFTTTKTAEVIDPDTGETISVTGTPLDAEGSRIILGGLVPNTNNTKRYSLERVTNSTLGAIATAGATATTCNAAQAANAAVSLAILAIPGGGFVKAAAGLLLDTAISVGMQVAITGMLSVLVPTIAKTLFTNVFDNATGVESGELFAKGAAAANTRVARSGSGQMPTSTENILAYNQATTEVLALDAEIERKNHSPLDAGSPNTFLGVLARKFTAFNTTTSLSGTVSTLSNVASQSIASLAGGSVYAAGEGSTYMTTFGDCPTLEAIGAKGDIYCNPITTADLSTINLAPDDETYAQVLAPNLTFDSSGNATIKNNSNLANYIAYCTERDSPFGIVDANIANAFLTDLGIVGNNLPILNDVLDIVNAAEEQAARPWATGSICINSASNPSWDTEMKYYQRYVEDTRILAQMGAYEDTTDPVTAYKEHYYTLHPLDNSDAGYLARISGITKEDAEVVLAMYDIVTEIAAYHPEDAYSFSDVSPNQSLFTEPKQLLSTEFPPANSKMYIPDAPDRFASLEAVLPAGQRMTFLDLSGSVESSRFGSAESGNSVKSDWLSLASKRNAEVTA